MWDMTPRKVLVAVDGTDCDAALEYAAEEARRRRCGVHLVHVVSPVTVGPSLDSVVMLNGELHLRGRTVLTDAASVLEPLLRDDDLDVSTELAHGAVVASLVAQSAHACLVLLQHRGMGAEDGPRGRSVTNGVGARAHAPVVAVPPGWRPAPASVVPVITVGVGDAAAAPLVVQAAVEAADRADARVRVLHGCGGPEGPDPDRHPEAAAEECRHREDQIRGAFEELFAARPQVPVEVVVTSAPPVDGLLAEAPGSTLLVVGRRHPRLPISAHLGPVARAVLRWSPVPVMVVDPVQVGPDGRMLSRDLAGAAIP